MEIKDFVPRVYQINIASTCKEKNTLVCLPTGTGKTKIGILAALERLNKFQESKVLVLTPTKPLAAQICNEFKNNTTINSEEVILLTGSISPKKRKEMYNSAKVIIATPQTIQQDLDNVRISMKHFSLLIVDECHRSKENFSNTKVAKYLIEQSDYPRILALTASPGSSKEIIREVCSNLNIESIEIRTAQDEDIKEFIQQKEIEYINVDFPEDFKKVHNILKELYNSKLENVKSFGITKPLSIINKTDLIILQKRLISEIKNKNKSAFYGMYLVSYLLKLNYAMELLETQSLQSLKEFFNKLKTDESKAGKSLISDEKIKKAEFIVEELILKGIKHPKLIKLIEIIKEELSKNINYKAIVFANYRNTVNEIVNLLNTNGIISSKFVGQADRKDKGLKQKEQMEIINKFKENKFSILVASSVGEEGIDIPEVNAVIFYEPIGSELRKIQRTGRTGRTKPGKIVFLMTKGTRDVGYFFSSLNKEKKMHSTLRKMKETSLFEYAKDNNRQ